MMRAMAVLSILGLSSTLAAAEGIESLDWLTGCWQSVEGEQLSEECWLPPRGGAMVGVNRTSTPDRFAFEFLRIVEDEAGVTYLASPSGRQAVPFRANEIADRRVVFSNPEHDFPQRITYWLDGDRLHARVEAEKEGKMDGFELVWDRAADGWGGAPDLPGD